MKPPTQPMQCTQLYKKIKRFINSRQHEVEGSTLGVMMKVTTAVFANRQGYVEQFGHLLLASRYILKVELGEAAIRRALKPARYISKWLDSLLGACKDLI